MRCTHLYLLTSTNVTHSRPETGNSPNTRCASKECSPWPKRYYSVQAVLSMGTVQECAARILASSAGIAPVQSASANDPGVHESPRSTMARGVRSGGNGRQKLQSTALAGADGVGYSGQRWRALAKVNENGKRR